MTIYVVRPGDTLWNIARRYGTTTEALSRINQLNDPAKLVPGMSLVIPGQSASRRSLEVNGYAYPNISAGTLREVLPYLSFICPFSYNVTTEGNLTPLGDEALLSAVSGSGTAPLLTVTNMGSAGTFSGETAHAVLTDISVQDKMLDNIISTMQAKNYYGAEFDFEYIYPYDRDYYSSFIRRAAERLHPLGYFVSSALAPKISDDQQGLLYYAHDYGAHGAYADRVVLMTYEWGYTYSQPQAVSPVNRIRQVLNYALTKMNAGKILLGFSNYGYDWSLPWRQGQAARVISNSAAQNLAAAVGAEVKFDEAAQAPHFEYTDTSGQRHEVWYEDGRSVRARLALVEEYGLAGISLWTINFLNRPLLEIINDTGSVEKIL